MSDDETKICATCKHFKAKPAGNNWCDKLALFLPTGCRGCPAWEAKARHWSDAAAGLIALHGRFDKPEGTMARWIREAHDAACKRREPNYEAMAKWVREAFDALISVEHIVLRLREADGGGK